MKRSWLLGLILAVLVVGGGVFVLRHTSHSSSQSSQTATQAGSGTASDMTKPLPAPTIVATAETRKNSFFLESVQIDPQQSPPRACLQFSFQLSEKSDIHYSDYVTIEPKADVSLQVAGHQLCLNGLNFAKNYSVTLAQGLPASNGDTLPAAQTTAITFGDSPPSVDFASNGFILPREDVQGVAIETVNVAKVKISVSRISDRALALSKILGRDIGETTHYSDSIGHQIAAPVWHGDMVIAMQKNKKILTAIPLSKIIDRSKPGAYDVMVSAADDDASDDNSDESGDGDDHPVRHHHHFYSSGSDGETYQESNRWILNTDLALTTMAGNDGLHVFVRSLKTAKALKGVKLSLVASSNEELGTIETDGDGHALFAPGLLRGKGAAAAHAVTAYLSDDFTLLELDRPGFDLSDRGVEGREQPGPIDAYLYTDRGIYRPGETVQLSALVRDTIGNTLEAAPVLLSLQRPDSVEVAQFHVTPNEVGMVTQAIDLSATAARGTWTITAKNPADKSILGGVSFTVQDFVPQRLKVNLTSDVKIATPSQPVTIHVNGRYLYGAPAANLRAEGEARLTVDETPFPQLKDFQFGLITDKFETQTLPIEPVESDSEGKADLSLPVPMPAETSLPLKLDIVAGLTEPGGRVTQDEISLPVSTTPLLIGIRPQFDSGYVREGQKAGFEIIARKPDGSSPEKLQVHYKIVKEVFEYNYYSINGSWHWRDSERDEPIAEGTLDIVGDAPSVVQSKTSWGRYRLEVSDDTTGAQSSVYFHGGYFSESVEKDSPEKIDVALVGNPPKPGETAKLKIKPPFAGEMVVTMASDRVFETQSLSVSADGTSVNVKTDPKWGSGAYAVVSVYRPQGDAKGHESLRAIGLVWIGLDQSDRTIAVTLPTIDKVTPRQEIELPVTVKNVPSGETAYLTLAAVDEGILQLTKFTSPDANEYFLGKRVLSETIRDDYSRLLDGNEAQAGALRQGGDQSGGAGLSVVPTRTVALFAGPIKLDSNGQAKIKFTLPDFNGQLRMMAIVASKTAFGHGDAPLTIRDPVVGEVSLPRFLAPDDDARLTLLLNNVDAVSGRYHVQLKASNAVSLGVGSIEKDYDLDHGAQKVETFPIKGAQTGIGKVSLVLTGPNNYHIERDWPIAVRGANYPLTVATNGTQNGGETFTVPVPSDFVAGSQTIAVNYSRVPGADLPGMIDALDLYPYGCSEQITSTGFPLIYYNKLKAAAGDKTDTDTQNRVQTAIGKLLDREDATGQFGLWHINDQEAGPWLNAYIVDFLQRAKTEGYLVPQQTLDRAYTALTSTAHSETSGFQVSYWLNDFWRRLETNRAAAYADLVLARAKQIEIADVRYFYDTQIQTLDSVGQAELGTALSLLGDKSRAAHAFDMAEAEIALKKPRQYFYWESALSDLASLIAFTAEAGDTARAARLAATLQTYDLRPESMNTQELAWVSIAAASLMKDSKPIALKIAGHEAPKPAATVSVKPTMPEVMAGYNITNTLSDAIFRSVVYRGVPKTNPPAMAQGFSVTETISDLKGGPVDIHALHQNARLMIRVQGKSTDQAYHQAIIVNMLPAGFEIESIVKPGKKGKADGYEWLNTLSDTKSADARDDRFVAAVDLHPAISNTSRRYRDDVDDDDSDNAEAPDLGENFNVAYVIRAVTPGKFALPAVLVEDMYKPQIMARSAVGNVTIAPAQ